MAPRKKKSTDTNNSTNMPRSPEQVIAALRKEVKLFYDFQRLRMQANGRTHHKPREDEDLIENGPVPEAKPGQSTDIILHPDDQANLEARGAELESVEKAALRDIDNLLDRVPFWTAILGNRDAHPEFRGIGPTLGGVILSQIDIRRAGSISALWQYCGMGTVHGYRCKACHEYVGDAAHGDLVVEKEGQAPHAQILPPPSDIVHPKRKFPPCELGGKELHFNQMYISGRAQRPTKGEKLSYNAFLRTKLLGVMGDVMIKNGSDKYRKVYYDYKARLQNKPWGKSDAHRHMASKRYMVKIMMSDIWTLWRTFEKLPVKPSYNEAVLGHKHHS